MNDLQVFNNTEFGEVRTIEKNGKVLFGATECAKVLGYTNPQRAIRDHCKGVNEIVTPTKGGTQKVKFITEGDLYRLIAHSKLPSAERFEHWVFDEVLPSIRINGGYIAGQDALSDEELLAKALMVAKNKIAEKEKQIERMRPKELFADAVSASKSSILVGDLERYFTKMGLISGKSDYSDG